MMCILCQGHTEKRVYNTSSGRFFDSSGMIESYIHLVNRYKLRLSGFNRKSKIFINKMPLSL